MTAASADLATLAFSLLGAHLAARRSRRGEKVERAARKALP
jgi:hypothetical protein